MTEWKVEHIQILTKIEDNDDVKCCPGLCCIPSLLERQVTTQLHGLRGMMTATEMCDNECHYL